MKVIHADKKILYSNPFRIIFAGLIIIAVAFGGFGAWATMSEITGAVIAPGVVKVSTNLKTVEHLEGGIVKEILVKDGDKVNEGDTLLVLDGTSIESNVEVIRGRLAQVLARAARLEAEIEMASEIVWPEGLTAMGPAQDVEQRMASEVKVFEANRSALEVRTGLLRAQIAQIRDQIEGLQEKAESERQIIASFEEELEAKERLREERFLDKSAILQLQRNMAARKGQLASAKSAIAENEERITELGLKINELQKEYVQQAVAQLSDIQSEVFDLSERLRPHEDAQKRLIVRAPATGTIVNMHIHTLGAVIAPNEPILDIVPEGTPLMAQCDIQTQDISRVSIGKEARIQLNAFKQSEVEPVRGTVTYVSADSVKEETPYGRVDVFKVHIDINADDLKTQDVSLSPGMPVTAFITTQERTFLEYIMDPLTSRFRKAFRE